MQRIVMLEFIDEAKCLLGCRGRRFLRSPQTLLICLDPKVRSFLRRRRIESQNTIDFLDNDAQHRIILKSEQATRTIVNRLNLRDSLGIEKGYRETCVHHIRLYINHFLWIIEIMKGLLRKYPGAEIHCCVAKDRQAMYSNRGYFQDQERFVGFLAKDFCQSRGIPFRAYPISLKGQRIIKQTLRWVIRSIGSLIALNEYRRSISSAGSGMRTLIVPAVSYNMGRVLSDIKNHVGNNVRYLMIWEGRTTTKGEVFKIYFMLVNRVKKLWRKHLLEYVIPLDLVKQRFARDRREEECIEREFQSLYDSVMHPEIREALQYEGISFASYFMEKMNHGLQRELLSLQHGVTALNQVFQRLRPDLLLSMYSVGITYMMGELSRILGFPCLNISHGTHVPPNNEFERIENFHLASSVISNTYQYVAVQTPWAERFLDYYEDDRERIRTGPLLYSRTTAQAGETLRAQVLGRNSGGKIVVHATTQKARTGFRFHITETLDEYLSTLTDLVEAVNTLQDVYLVIRPHPACNLTEEDFRTLLPKSRKVWILAQGSFASILSGADLLISYSSTCIEEALQNGVPVVLYDKWARYNHFNVRETVDVASCKRQAVYYCTKTELLGPMVRRILDIFLDDPLRNEELELHRYSEDYRVHFFKFVDRCLNGKEGLQPKVTVGQNPVRKGTL